jgi:two-component system, sporulation sensor kinase E
MTESSPRALSLETESQNPLNPSQGPGDIEDQVSSILPHMAAGIVVLSADQSISSWNSRAEHITGYTFQEVSTVGLDQLFEPAEIMQHLLNKAQQGIPTLNEFTHLRHANGKLLRVAVQCSPQRHMGHSSCDIVVAFRELEPLQERFRRDDHLIMLGRLASSLSHEIRNPLNAIFLHTDVLEEELKQPTPDHQELISESLATIKTEIMRVNELVQDYLSLARLSTLQREVVDMGTMMEEFALEITELLADHQVTLELEMLADLGQVALHRNTLRRALLNLVHNAIDAMPEGGTLTLSGRRTAAHVYLEVRDTGMGIPKDQLPLLFTPFHTTKPGGTGFGLYVVQEIIVSHDGEITVSSEPGVGTTFTVVLPLAADVDNGA